MMRGVAKSWSLSFVILSFYLMKRDWGRGKNTWVVFHTRVIKMRGPSDSFPSKGSYILPHLWEVILDK